MILLYWDIGRGIVEKQQTLGLGRIGGGDGCRRPAAGFPIHERVFPAQCVVYAASLRSLFGS